MRPSKTASAALILASLSIAGWAAAWALAGSADARGSVASDAPAAPPSRQPEYGTLDEPRHIVVRDLPGPAAALGQSLAVPNPARTPDTGARADPPGTNHAPPANAVDSAARATEPRLPPDLLTSFDGLDSTVNPVGLTPPDPQIAVGPNHVVEFVNITGRISTKAGAPVSTFPLRDFFALSGNTAIEADPKIMYDDIDDRFFAAYFDFDTVLFGHVHLAVSQTDDPTGAWDVYILAFGIVIPDYPGLAVTNDKVTVSVNIFELDDAYVGEQTIVLQKSDMLAGSAADVAIFAIDPNRFTVRPAQNLSPAGDQYLTTWDLSTFDELTVTKITGTPEAANVAATSTNLVTLAQDTPPPSLTAGPGDIDSGDFRVLEAVWRDNSLWSASSATCQPIGDGVARSCAHLVEVDTSGTPDIVQDIMYGAAGEYYSWPAIRTDSSGDLYVSVSHTNSGIFAEARTAGRLATDPPGMMRGSCLLKAGEVVHLTDRWGDYLGAAVDPSDPSKVWVVGQYAKNDGAVRWGTYIGSLSYSEAGGCAAPLDIDTDWDGCTNERELGPDPLLGGQRDPNDFWDFFDVPTGAGLTRDRDIGSLDIFAVIGRFNSTDLGPGDFDRNSDPLSTPNQPDPSGTQEAYRQNYHPAYDRGALTGPNAWNTGPADGAIAALEIFSVISQFGHTCS